ncbi:hypothetical protein RYX36_006102 [Vicia faba]
MNGSLLKSSPLNHPLPLPTTSISACTGPGHATSRRHLRTAVNHPPYRMPRPSLSLSRSTRLHHSAHTTPTSTQIATVRHCEASSASSSLSHLSQPNSFTDAKPSFTQKHQCLSDIVDVNLLPEPIASIP